MALKDTLNKIKRRFTDEDNELPAWKTNQDVAREEAAAADKAKYLKRYGEGLSDSLKSFKKRGDLGMEMSRTASPEGQGFEEMKDAIRAERTRAGLSSDGMKKGGKVKAKKMASGGKVSQLAKANGIAIRGKTKGKIC